jgi:hypothetical protein
MTHEELLNKLLAIDPNVELENTDTGSVTEYYVAYFSIPVEELTKPCNVCGQYEVWSLYRQAVTRCQEGENIQNAFHDKIGRAHD